MISQITKEKLWIAVVAILLFIIAIVIYFYYVSSPEPKKEIQHRLPAFAVPELFHPDTFFRNKTLDNKVDLVIFWNSSCQACMEENNLLMYIASTHLVTLYGIDYKDNSNKAKAYFKKHGDPFKAIAVDSKGHIGLMMHVQNTPETFVIGKHGVIKGEFSGPITPIIWFNELMPEINKLDKAK